ncbi:MAG: 3'(2'),5'-bisphosphate nucleotidase CysQ [Flavobacteriales bacterium]|nr:3'(2'),5'-bisphosphate nucleotidase CysQ [Flavobacteriales bacterium]
MMQQAIKGAYEAGLEILEVYGTEFSVDVKEDKSPLTEADRRAHNKIMEFLDGTGIPVLSEEGKHLSYDERKGWKQFWLVDPLDGTKEFVKRNGEFTVNIALIEDGVPVSGVIYVPVKDEMYIGIKGLGAFKIDNYSKIHASHTDLNDLLSKGNKLPIKTDRKTFSMVGSRSHMSDETLEYFEKMKEEHGEVEMVSMGSSLKLCLVAEGAADVYPRFAPTMEWDTGAGDAIARNAGCVVTEKDEVTPLVYNKENLLNPWFIIKR